MLKNFQAENWACSIMIMLNTPKGKINEPIKVKFEGTIIILEREEESVNEMAGRILIASLILFFLMRAISFHHLTALLYD